MSIARFATLSDGRFLEFLSSFKSHEARLGRFQQSLSRKTKFSSNWWKAKAKGQRISAAGTTEQSGKHALAISRLNTSILDQNCFAFRKQLEYKLAWAGGWLMAVPAHNTSRTCPA